MIFSLSLMAPLPNTITAYRSGFIQSQTWRFKGSLATIPTSADNMSIYLGYIVCNKKNTILRRILGLGKILKPSQNYHPSNQQDMILAIKRMHRKTGRPQKRTAQLTKSLLKKLLKNCDHSIMGLRNQVLLRLRYGTMRRRSVLSAYKFEYV